MAFNFKKYVKSLLVEDARSSNLAGYTEEAAYENVNGVYVAKDIAKDPYTYSVASNNSQEIVIRVESAPSNRQSAVGRKFKITKNNLDNPNVQLLYASIIADKPTYNLNVSGLKFSDINFETVIGDDDFNFDNFFQEQFNKIIAVGKENASTTLKSPNKIFKLSTGQTGELLIKNQGDLTQFIAAIEKNIEQQYDVIVVALGIEVNDVQRAAGPINEQSVQEENNVNRVYVLMKRGALSYYKINFAPDINIFIEDNAMITAAQSPEQPIEVNVTRLESISVFDNPEEEVVPDVVPARVQPPEQGETTQAPVNAQEHTTIRVPEGAISLQSTNGRNYKFVKPNNRNICAGESEASLNNNCYSIKFTAIGIKSDIKVLALRNSGVDTFDAKIKIIDRGTVSINNQLADMKNKGKLHVDVFYDNQSKVVTIRNISYFTCETALEKKSFFTDPLQPRYVLEDDDIDMSALPDSVLLPKITLTKV